MGSGVSVYYRMKRQEMMRLMSKWDGELENAMGNERAGQGTREWDGD